VKEIDPSQSRINTAGLISVGRITTPPAAAIF
jgi:hypothetical protein